MKKISNFQSFEVYKISKQSMNSISGSRTRKYEEATIGGRDTCVKRIDNNDGVRIKTKIKDRYEGKC